MKFHANQTAQKLSTIYDSINEKSRRHRQDYANPSALLRKKKVHPRPSMQVSPNLNAIRPFVAAMRSQKVVGWVRWGNEFGLLAISPDGRFLRVNGSQTEILDEQEVLQAITSSKHKWR